MLKIGFDKSDPNYRKFYFDDSQVLTSNPPKYKIWYVDDESDIDFIECSKVFYLKPAQVQKQEHVEPIQETTVKVKPVESPQLTLSNSTYLEKSTIAQPETPKITVDLNQVNIIPKKKRGRPKKDKVVEEVYKETDNISNSKLSYEYKVIDEYLKDGVELETILNEHGDDGWELCGFEIYKTGLTKQNTILCIFKRIKR